MTVRLSALTNVGMERDHNEDNFTIVQCVSPFMAWDYHSEGFESPENGLLLLVADGMGGTNAGEVASSIVVKVVEDEFLNASKLPETESDKEEFLKTAIHKSKKQIVKEAKANIEYRGMGTTVVIAWIVGNKCHLAWAGDSRAYRLSKNKALEIVSRDHSLVWELMEKGILTEEEAETHPDSNIITQSLSDSGNKLKPETKTIDIFEGDKLLLCSDGLNGMVSKNDIAKLLSSNQGEVACNKLVSEANNNGGTDNITVVLMETSPFWEDDYMVKPIDNEEDYDPITEKTIKVVGSTKVVPKEIDEAEKDNAEAQTENKKSGGGFLKKLWNRIIATDVDESTETTKDLQTSADDVAGDSKAKKTEDLDMENNEIKEEN
jgi:serine/threonine protein phosphatase PrpC